MSMIFSDQDEHAPPAQPRPEIMLTGQGVHATLSTNPAWYEFITRSLMARRIWVKREMVIRQTRNQLRTIKLLRDAPPIFNIQSQRT